MAKKVGKVSKVSKRVGDEEGFAPAYRTEILENVPAERVQPAVSARRENPDYVRHSIEAEPDGEFTIFFIFRR